MTQFYHANTRRHCTNVYEENCAFLIHTVSATHFLWSTTYRLRSCTNKNFYYNNNCTFFS